MGTYLSKPITDKVSQDTDNGSLNCGASSMQGWRESQEDAHNCILDFDDNVSLFAVYDGHGGAEVAQYAADKLPALVKNDLYKNGDYEKALIKAYLDFDDSLTDPTIVDALTALREAEEAEDCEEEEDDDEREELNELFKEANIPIEHLIKKYKKEFQSASKENSEDSKPNTSEVKINDACGSSSSSTVTDDKTKDANGVTDIKTDNDGSSTVESSSSTKINGIQKGDETNGTEESVAESSGAECSTSGSKGHNGDGKRSAATACLITDDSDDDDDDEDDEMFEASMNTNDESNSEDSDGDCEDDDEDEEDDSILLDEDDEGEEKAGKDSGCTAVMALLVNNKLYVANAGDSRCVVSIDGKAHDMSKDHKPEDEPELKRIQAAGGRVSNDGRVNGGLNLSRALGDHNYKRNDKLPNTEQMITALPDVSVLDISSEKDSFLVLACDGIWNSLTSQEVVDFVSERMKPDVKLSSICEELFDKCLAPNTMSDGTGCDNMTCIIVKLKHNQKRTREDDEEEKSDEGVECKKLKLNSTESESVH